jgi:hypothetical protein
MQFLRNYGIKMKSHTIISLSIEGQNKDMNTLSRKTNRPFCIITVLATAPSCNGDNKILTRCSTASLSMISTDNPATQLCTDVSGQPIGSIFKGQEVQEDQDYLNNYIAELLQNDDT